MNITNSSSVVPFGRLEWNISQETSIKMSIILDWTHSIIGVGFQFTVILFFLINFCNPKSLFRQPYYIIYTIECVVDLIPKLLTILYYNVNEWFMYPSPGFQWYMYELLPICNLLLAINRFTAVIFSLQYTRIWSKLNTVIICILLVLYPCLIHSFNLNYIWCGVITTYSCPNSIKQNISKNEFEIYMEIFSLPIYSVLATVFSCSAAIFLIVNNKKLKLKNQKVEKALLIQSIASSIFLLLSALVEWLVTVNGAPKLPKLKTPEIIRAMNLANFFGILREIFFALHHYSSIFVLFVLS